MLCPNGIENSIETVESLYIAQVSRRESLHARKLQFQVSAQILKEAASVFRLHPLLGNVTPHPPVETQKLNIDPNRRLCLRTANLSLE